MRAKVIHSSVVLAWLIGAPLCLAGDVLFEDTFDDGLSQRWEIIGLKQEDYRIRDGALELRVQPGKLTRDTPMFKVILPFTSSDTVIASVEVTVLDPFTEPAEFAGLFLIDEHGPEFGARKQHLDGQLLFAPGRAQFIGRPGEESDPQQYALQYWPARKDMGPLRIIVRSGYAYFQVGPSSEGRYANFFHSAINTSEKERGFVLTAAGGPQDAAHWVRFDNFRVER